MIVRALKSKIHRATVTEANIDYIGSISIDKKLMDAANLLPYEQVQVLNITNGSRLDTYVIEAPENSGEICINGAATHLVSCRDLIIIVAYCSINHSDLANHNPAVVHVDKHNCIVAVGSSVMAD